MKKIIYLLFIAFAFSMCSDDDLIVNPTTNLGDAEAITSEADLRLATNSVYNRMLHENYYDGLFLTAGDMLGDDFISPEFASNWLDTYCYYGWSRIAVTTSLYQRIYSIAAHINSVLDKVDGIEDEGNKDAIIAELKALRAFVHFDLSKLYGPLPVNLGRGTIATDALCIPIMDETRDPSDYEGMLRKPVNEVYNFITTELEAALPNLPTGQQRGTFGADAAKAALARVYLYMGNWEMAKSYSEAVIADYPLITRDNYVASWLETYNSESIFELDVTVDDNNDINSIGYYVLADGTSGYKEIAESFHFKALRLANPDDVRTQLFVLYDETDGMGYLPTGKYPGRDGNPYVNNIKVFRSSEMYLIASEANLKLGNTSLAVQHLNTLNAQRTGVTDTYSSVTIDDILTERRLELFCEGHRAWDLWRNQRSVVRWTNFDEKDNGYIDDKSDGTIEFDWFKTILAIDEDQISLLPEEYQESQQNPGYN